MMHRERSGLPTTQDEATSLQADTYRPLIGEDLTQRDIEEISLREYFEILYRRRWVMLATFAIVFVVGMLYTYTRRPIYEASAKIVIATRGASPTISETDMPLLGDLQALTRNRTVDAAVEIISSMDLLDQAFNNLNPRLVSKGFAGNSLPGWACRVAAKKNTDLIAITGRAYDPTAAAALANTVADTYFKRDLEQGNRAIRQARVYAEEKMAIAAKQLSEANAELSKFKRQTGLIQPETQLAKVAENMAQLTIERDMARAEAVSCARGIGAMKAQIAAQQQNVVANRTVTFNPQFTAIQGKLVQLNSDRAALLQEYTPESREVKRIEGQIRQEEARLRTVSQTIVGTTTHAMNPIHQALLTKYATDVAALAAMNGRVQSLSSEIKAREQAASVLPERERRLREYMQRVSLLERTYEMLSGKYYALLLSEQAMLPNGMLVSSARTPGGPAYPNPKRNAMLFIMLGAILAVGTAVLTERLDYRVHDQGLAEQMSGSFTLSLVPQVVGDVPQLAGSTGHNHHALVESFRILRNNIAFCTVDKPPRILAVTSPGRAEGKSTTAINLAIATAMEGKRVLLVDCDLRRPTLHRFAGVSHGVGLTSVLAGTATLEEAVVSTKVENVSCLPSGSIPRNPAEILSSKRNRELFRELAERYDSVIVDCPPCTGLSDIQVISTLVEGLLLVVSANQTLKPHLQITMRTLMQAEAPLIGLVFNRIDLRHQGYRYYYDYDYTSADLGGVT